MSPASPHSTYVRDTALPGEWRAAGPHTVALAYAGATFTFRGLSSVQADTARRKFAPLLAAAAAHDAPPLAAEVDVGIADGSRFLRPDTRAWEYVLGISYAAERITVSGMRFLAVIERGGATHRQPMRARLVTDLVDDADFIDPFENLFRVLVAYAVLHRGGLVLHSAGFVDGERGFVGFGHSGAGKTTLTGLVASLGLEVLSDELNALVWDGATPRLLALPFAGDYGQARADGRTVDLQALYRLRQAPDPRAVPLSRATQVAELIASAPFVNGDPAESDRVWQNATALVGKVPVRALEFAKDTRFLEAIRTDQAAPSRIHV